MLLLWPGWVRRKREDDFGQIGPALFAGNNISDQSIKEISSTSYSATLHKKGMIEHFLSFSSIFLQLCMNCDKMFLFSVGLF